MLDISIKTIPHKEQLYETVGNYIEEDGHVLFEISDMGNWHYEILVAIHELLEYAMVKHLKIPIRKIDLFDMKFEEDRKKGLHYPDDEPGDDPKAPYYTQHQIATAVERLLAGLMKVNWEKYDKAVMRLSK